MKRSAFALFVIGLLASAGPASAGVVVYDNITGTTDNFNIDAWTIYGGNSVANSFTLGSAANVTSVNFWAWEGPSDHFLSVGWEILDNNDPTDPIGSGTVAASGTAGGLGLTDAFDEVNSFPWHIDEITLSTGGVSLAAGTYWLLLQNGSVTNGDVAAWDQSDGASVAYENGLGPMAEGSGPNGPACANGKLGAVGNGTSCSESFQIVATTTTPEPRSLMLFGSGILLLAGAWCRRASR